LVDSVENIMIHGLANPKSNSKFYRNQFSIFSEKAWVEITGRQQEVSCALSLWTRYTERTM